MSGEEFPGGGRPTRRPRWAWPLLVLLAMPSAALALPRFAARSGTECIQCHVNPTGGGMRNEYGRNVFANVYLPWSARGEPDSWMAPTFPPEGEEPEQEPGTGAIGFSPELTEWLALGSDLRASYIFIRPDRPPSPGVPRDVTNTFFLMQADLYTSARLHDRVTLYLDVGVYTGFEAWGLIRLTEPGAPLETYLKVGRFLPPFGLRDVEHQLFTREGIGFGSSDRDTGLELGGYVGPLAFQAAVLNGTLGDTAFDAPGRQRRTFEKALAARLSLRGALGNLRAQVGGSFYFSENANQANPLLAASVPSAVAPQVSLGVNELRAGGLLMLGLGRFTYLGDLAVVHNRFNPAEVPRLMGYASYQELAFVPVQGLELVSTYEFKDPNVEVLGNTTHRAGLAVEFFPWSSTEVRAMVRRTFGDDPASSPSWDVVLFLHLFM